MNHVLEIPGLVHQRGFGREQRREPIVDDLLAEDRRDRFGYALVEELAILWRREMVAGTYMPRWLSADIGNQTVRAIAFVVNQPRDELITGAAFAGDHDG